MGLKEMLDGLATEAAARAARLAAEKAAGEALDDLETALLGKVGAADEILKKDDGSSDPLEAARRRYGVGGGSAPAAPPKEDPLAKAKAELAELKRKRAGGS